MENENQIDEAEVRLALAIAHRRVMSLDSWDVYEAIIARRLREPDTAELPEPGGPLCSE